MTEQLHGAAGFDHHKSFIMAMLLIKAGEKLKVRFDRTYNEFIALLARKCIWLISATAIISNYLLRV
jgi:hypothetical protein